eukprot:scaffold11769_cov97-Isochrysis_galbana.AAC.8
MRSARGRGTPAANRRQRARRLSRRRWLSRCGTPARAAASLAPAAVEGRPSSLPVAGCTPRRWPNFRR